MLNENKEIYINSNIDIKDESEVIYASSIGVGGNNEEFRLIIVNNKLINKNDNFELSSESNLQIVMTPTTAIKLKDMLDKYIHEKQI